MTIAGVLLFIVGMFFFASGRKMGIEISGKKIPTKYLINAGAVMTFIGAILLLIGGIQGY